MSVQSKIREELSNATNVVKRSRDREEYFRQRLVFAVTSFEESQWSSLSDVAQKWINEAIEALNKKENLPAFPDEEEALKKLKESCAKSVDHRENNQLVKGRGAGERVKELMLEHGVNMKVNDIYDTLKLEGYKYSIHTIPVVRAEFKRALKMLWDRGMLKDKPKGM